MPLLHINCGYTALQWQAKECFFQPAEWDCSTRPLDFRFSKTNDKQSTVQPLAMKITRNSTMTIIFQKNIITNSTNIINNLKKNRPNTHYSKNHY